MHDIILGLVSGGALAALITSVTAILQTRKSKQDEILMRLDKIKEEQDKSEKDALRTQLLVLLADYRDEKSEILTAAERYFSPPLCGDWFMTPLFLKWIQEKEIGKPEWFDPDR